MILTEVEYSLIRNFRELAREIHVYESDTFSAEGSEITKEEADSVALQFVAEDIQARINTDTMDGHMIDDTLSEIRDAE